MYINNIDSTGFGGVFRIKNTPANKEFIEKQIVPIYKFMRNQPITIFSGMNPLRDAYVSAGIKCVAEAENSSEEWVISNAAVNGINIAEKADDTLHVITGASDCLKLLSYLKKYMESHFINMGFFKIMKLAYREAQNKIEAQSQNMPSHLLPLVKSLIENEKESKRFQEEYMKDCNVKTCESVNELLNAVMINE